MAPTEILAAQHAQKLAPLLLPFGIAVEAVFGSQGARERRTRERAHRLGRGRAGRRHARAAHRKRRIRAAGPGDHRRAAPLRRRAARATARQERRAAHALHDRDADPAHARANEVRRPRSLDHRRAAARPHAGRHLRRSARAARARSTTSCARTSNAGRQAYVVAPAIDAGETALRSALAEAEYMRRDVFPDLRVAVLHGRMPPKEKDAVMDGFKRGDDRRARRDDRRRSRRRRRRTPA